MTARGKILIIKIKGDHLDNDESKAKNKDWVPVGQFRWPDVPLFYGVPKKTLDWPGTYSYNRFIKIVKGL